MRKLVALVAVASLFVWSSPAQAQRSPYRDGWWGSFNIGPGWNSSDNLALLTLGLAVNQFSRDRNRTT